MWVVWGRSSSPTWIYAGTIRIMRVASTFTGVTVNGVRYG